MTRGLILLAALTGGAAQAQLQLFVAPQGGAEQPVTGIFDVGRTLAGESSATRFRLRNTGLAQVSLTALHVSGSGFSLTGAPSLPHIVAPGANVDFSVHFRPPDHGSFSASLQVNSVGHLLRGTGVAAASLFAAGSPVSSGSTVDFGRVERGGERVLTFEARNVTTGAATLTSVELSGAAFSLVEALPLPAVLQPGGSLRFNVRFAPASNAILTGKLTVDETRVIHLTGTGLEPPLPRPVLVLASAVLRSGEQGRVAVQLAEASRANGKGQLRLELKTAAPVKDNDAAVQFVSGGRTASFSVVEGASSVTFDKGGSSGLVFQTGTTAGTLEIVVELGGYSERVAISIAAEPIRVDRVTVSRGSSSLDVQISAFDNTRTAGELTFTFFGPGGQALAPVRVNAAADFARWWENSTLGGTFAMRASFPVTGDVSLIRAVEIELRNASGTVKTDRLSF